MMPCVLPVGRQYIDQGVRLVSWRPGTYEVHAMFYEHLVRTTSNSACKTASCHSAVVYTRVQMSGSCCGRGDVATLVPPGKQRRGANTDCREYPRQHSSVTTGHHLEFSQSSDLVVKTDPLADLAIFPETSRG